MAIWRVTGGDVRIHDWAVFRTTSTPSTFHVIGDDGREGKVCSPILRVNRSASYVETRSRKYFLVGAPGLALTLNADYVFSRWKSINHCSDVELFPTDKAWAALIDNIPPCHEASTSNAALSNDQTEG